MQRNDSATKHLVNTSGQRHSSPRFEKPFKRQKTTNLQQFSIDFLWSYRTPARYQRKVKAFELMFLYPIYQQT